MSFRDHFFERFPALSSRDFVLFWVGQFISLTGTWMQSTTQPYLAYQLTGRPFDLGLIGFAGTLPTLLLALPAGVWIERHDKRKIVILLQAVMMVQSLTLAFLTLSGLIQLWHIVVLALVLGVANAVEITARQAMLIELVGKGPLPNAIALQATIFNAARVLGPSLVAPFLIFIKNNGAGWAFLANGISYLFVIIALFYARTPFKEAIVAKPQKLLEGLREGQKYILSTASVGMLILMATIVGLIGFPFIQQIPVVARDVLAQIGDTDAAVAARNSALYTFQGIGALIAAITLAAFNPRRKGWLLTFGQAAFIFGLIGLGLTRNVTLALVLMVLLGWGTVTQLATMNTLIQLQVPNELRGRVFSTYLWGLQGIAPFGSILIGVMAQSWSVPITALVCGGIALLAIGGIHLFNPFIRETVG
ncbi:MAG: MFS transporter [Chloroflexi bacterium HGW-Chloroflexi-6]|nr:MAG: MFS transporter [Chloroflexi bacterium HGW-Chloroflexi-6]